MISEDYVNFEVAKLLEEKGFDEPCRSYFTDNVDYISYSYSLDALTKLNMGVWETLRPTYQMVIKWLEEIHHIFIEISTSVDLNGNYHHSYGILDKECKYVKRGYTDFDAALKYTLEKLI